MVYALNGNISHEMDKIVFDLDGTLLDSRKRLHALFTKLVPDLSLSFDEYWEIKRKGTSHKELIKSNIGRHNEFDYLAFQENWMRLIESPKYLALDKPYAKSSSVLEALKKKGIKIFLCTARQSFSGVEEQLEKFKWLSHFHEIYVTEQKMTKVELLENSIQWDGSYFVGDTSQDIKLARAFGAISIAVTNGFRSKQYLAQHAPDHIIEDIFQILKIIH